jgi:hypothetical protein
MAVEVNTERKLIEISWDELAESGPPDTEAPPGFPAHPIAPGGEAPDQGLPSPGEPTHPIAPGGETPEHPIAPGGEAPDQGLPGEQPGVEHPIFLPPYVDNTLPGAVKEKLREFLTGNLPPYEHPEPMGGKVHAVQVFAQGQDGDWSNTAVQPNDGLAALSYPKDFKGESYVEVRGLDGSLVDSGTITID